MTEAIQLAEISIAVTRKDIKKVHLIAVLEKLDPDKRPPRPMGPEYRNTIGTNPGFPRGHWLRE